MNILKTMAVLILIALCIIIVFKALSTMIRYETEIARISKAVNVCEERNRQARMVILSLPELQKRNQRLAAEKEMLRREKSRLLQQKGGHGEKS